ncbi:DsbC family protein [Wenzhouxiangella sp. AB-CW3]|uniref:DsbC family protein n=1 Tax=Wenzhouxiangella sp. AB-CW3 TaxID=2771012 RepID=UPI00168AE748|nr:DsbC family protein [Wenzhouxiangella sp. AB-CW3]QOC23038.1 DsbC family protein [Wenzhouxiangella sp. AB-CW3]
MNVWLKTAVAVVVMWVGGAGQAADYAAIEDRISGLVAEVNELSVAETPVPGLKQVRVNNDIIYMSADGRYLLQGRFIDLDTQTDLTDAAKSDMRRERLAGLDSSQFVSFGPENAEYDVIVFTDPDCGYCRRMHEQIEEYASNGIQVHYLAFPRAGVGSQTYDTLVSVWCAHDQQEAMDVAKAGQTPPRATCDNPVEEQYQLGQSLGVTGTPSMMTFNGDMIPGYVPPEQLKSRLESLNGQH